MLLKYLLGISSDRSWVRFLNNLGRGIFPKIPDHTRYHRRTKEMLQIFEQFRQHLLQQLKVKNDQVRLIDSTSLPVIRYSRAGRSPLVKSFERAGFGYCATQDEKYFGLKLHLLTTVTGIPTNFDLTEASLPDIKMVKELIGAFKELILIGDKGYLSQSLKQELSLEGKHLVTLYRRNQKQKNTQAEKQLLKYRKVIETVFSQLKDQFQLTKLRVKSLMGLVIRILGIMTAFTLAIYLNRLLGRSTLKIKGLLL